MSSERARDSVVARAIQTVREAPLSTPVVELPPYPYKVSFGYFGLITRNPTSGNVRSMLWEGCRDRLQSSIEAYNDFLFYHYDDAGDHVIDFVRTMEEVIAIKAAWWAKKKGGRPFFADTDRLVPSKTNQKNILHFQMSGWWKYRVRRSFLTAAVRAGQFYRERTAAAFNLAMKSQSYLTDTAAAVNEFVYEGRTSCRMKKNDSFGGWQSQFAKKAPAEARRVLKRVVKKSVPESGGE